MGEAYCSSVIEGSQGSRFSSALSGSVSFGRFLSESLDWGKWSSFSQNRYLEDAQKYSVPGGVAQKKAFFEARYKRAANKRSAAALEHASPSVHDASEAEVGNGFRSHTRVPDPVVQSCNWSNGIITCNVGEANQIFYTTSSGSNSSQENSQIGIMKSEKPDTMEKDHTEMPGPSVQSESPTIVDDRENQNKVSGLEIQELRVNEKQPLKESCIANHRTPEAVIPKQKISTPKQSPLHKKSRLSSCQPSKFPASPLPSKSSLSHVKETSCNLSSNKTHVACSHGKKDQAISSFDMSINLPECNKCLGTPAKCSPTTKRTVKANVTVEESEFSNDHQNHAKTPASGRGVTKRDPVDAHSQKKRFSKCTPIKGCIDAIEIASSSMVNRNHARPEKNEKMSNNSRHKSDLNERRRLHNDAPEKSDEPKILRESCFFKARPLPAFYKSIDHTSNGTKVTKMMPDGARSNKVSDQMLLSSFKQSIAKISSRNSQLRGKCNNCTTSVTLARNKFK